MARGWRNVVGDFFIVLGKKFYGDLSVGYDYSGDVNQEPYFFYWGQSLGERPLVVLQATRLGEGTFQFILSPKQAMMLCESGLDAVSASLDNAGVIEAPDWDVRTVKPNIK